MSIPELYEKFASLNVKDIQVKSIQDAEAEIIDTITEVQLYGKGIDGTGKSLGEYSPVTKQIKASKGQRIDHITLRDTGEFHSGYKMDKLDYGGSIYSSDSKAAKLESDYGSEIYSLTDENQAAISEDVILFSFLKYFRKHVQL